MYQEQINAANFLAGYVSGGKEEQADFKRVVEAGGDVKETAAYQAAVVMHGEDSLNLPEDFDFAGSTVPAPIRCVVSDLVGCYEYLREGNYAPGRPKMDLVQILLSLEEICEMYPCMRYDYPSVFPKLAPVPEPVVRALKSAKKEYPQVTSLTCLPGGMWHFRDADQNVIVSSSEEGNYDLHEAAEMCNAVRMLYPTGVSYWLIDSAMNVTQSPENKRN